MVIILFAPDHDDEEYPNITLIPEDWWKKNHHCTDSITNLSQEQQSAILSIVREADLVEEQELSFGLNCVTKEDLRRLDRMSPKQRLDILFERVIRAGAVYSQELDESLQPHKLGSLYYETEQMTLVSGSNPVHTSIGGLELQYTLQMHWKRYRVNAVAFSPNSNYLVTCEDYNAYLWDLQSSKLITKMYIEGGSFDMAISPTGDTVAFGRDSDIAVLKFPDLVNPFVQGDIMNIVWSVSYDPLGKNVAGAGFKMKIVSIENKSEWNLLGVPSENVRLVRFSPDGKQLVYSVENILTFNDVLDHSIRKGMTVEFPVSVIQMKYNPDGQYLALLCKNGMIVILRTVDHQVIIKLCSSVEVDIWVGALAWHPKLPLLCAGIGTHYHFINAITGDHYTNELEEKDIVAACAFSPEGNLLVTGSNWDGTNVYKVELTQTHTVPPPTTLIEKTY